MSDFDPSDTMTCDDCGEEWWDNGEVECPCCGSHSIRHVTEDALAARLAALEQQHAADERALRLAREAKDNAYAERDQLVAALSKLFPASLERHPAEEEWEDDWRWIVFIDLPTGQASWHIHDSELPLFAHLPRLTGRKWDGHTTEEKYRRLAALPEPPTDAGK